VCACGLGDPHSPCRWGGHKDRRIVHAWRHCRGGGIHSPLQSPTRARRGPSAHRSKSPHGDPLTTRHTRETRSLPGLVPLCTFLGTSRERKGCNLWRVILSGPLRDTLACLEPRCPVRFLVRHSEPPAGQAPTTLHALFRRARARGAVPGS
jgi:hypothetical protein